MNTGDSGRESFRTDEEFVAWLLGKTVSALRRGAGDPDSLKAVVFLYLNRAYEAGLPAERIVDVLGAGSTSALSLAALSKIDERTVMDAFDEFDELIEATYASRKKN